MMPLRLFWKEEQVVRLIILPSIVMHFCLLRKGGVLRGEGIVPFMEEEKEAFQWHGQVRRNIQGESLQSCRKKTVDGLVDQLNYRVRLFCVPEGSGDDREKVDQAFCLTLLRCFTNLLSWIFSFSESSASFGSTPETPPLRCWACCN